MGSALVPHLTRVHARLRVPGDKSISHRYAMLGALADGVSHLDGYLAGADCIATLSCLEAYGVPVSRSVSARGLLVRIDGRGLRGFRPPSAPLDCANSGTSMRLLAGLAAAHPFRSVLGGDESLARRPMRRVIEPLTSMGATIAASEGRPPLTIDGANLHAIAHAPDVPSAQVKSAVLLAGLHAEGRTSVREPAPTRDHTERALEAFGAHVVRDGSTIAIDGGQRLHAIDARIPGDISSAVFWLALAAGIPDSEITIEDVGLNPSRSAVLDVLRRSGARIETSMDQDRAGEPIGSIHVRSGDPRSFEVTAAEVPLMIDEIPALAALAAMRAGVTMTVRGASELRVKESDRIAMLARGFRAMGVGVEEYDDGFSIAGGPPSGGDVDAAGDHRLAMAFAIAGTAARAPVSIQGAESVAVSYPGFFTELERLAQSR
ncbi:MAG: 3-phosphoshikimate 1-carboxyvinyltransferase [Acidobacteria bacterium]|nr:MAG: 3-phosphoshikimate 1-carboxyvinyltransferase [Acidobacteriota bacterium]